MRRGLQNFIADHRDIELLKLKSYTVGKKIDDKLFTSADGQAQIAEIIGAMSGFVCLGPPWTGNRRTMGACANAAFLRSPS